MKLLRIITEADFGRENHPENWPKFVVRPSARAIILNDRGEVGLMHVTQRNIYKLAGGGHRGK
jgi:hypothetical protein